MNIGLDIGNGYVKAISGEARLAFASAIGQWTPETNGSKVRIQPPNTSIVSVDGTMRIVGDYAARQSRVLLSNMNDQRWMQPDVIRLLATTALGLISKRTKKTSFNLVTGLPLTHFSAHASKVGEILRGHYAATIDGSDVEFDVSIKRVGIGILRCTVGTWAETVKLEPSGDLVPYQKVGIVDVGTGTTDITLVELMGDEPTINKDQSASFNDGWVTVTSRVNDFLREQGTNADHWQIDEAITKYRCKMGMLDIEAAAQDGIKILADTVCQDITKVWGNCALIDHIFLCGGPANTLGSIIKAKLGLSQIQFMPEPFWTTASGYLRMANYAPA